MSLGRTGIAIGIAEDMFAYNMDVINVLIKIKKFESVNTWRKNGCKRLIKILLKYAIKQLLYLSNCKAYLNVHQ